MTPGALYRAQGGWLRDLGERVRDAKSAVLAAADDASVHLPAAAGPCAPPSPAAAPAAAPESGLPGGAHERPTRPPAAVASGAAAQPAHGEASSDGRGFIGDVDEGEDEDDEDDLGPDGWDDVLGAWMAAINVPEKLAAAGVDPSECYPPPDAPPGGRAAAADPGGSRWALPSRAPAAPGAARELLETASSMPSGARSARAVAGEPAREGAAVAAHTLPSAVREIGAASAPAALEAECGERRKLAHSAPQLRHSAMFGGDADSSPSAADRAAAPQRPQSAPGLPWGSLAARGGRAPRAYRSVLPIALQQAADGLPCLGAPDSASAALDGVQPPDADPPAPPGGAPGQAAGYAHAASMPDAARGPPLAAHLGEQGAAAPQPWDAGLGGGSMSGSARSERGAAQGMGAGAAAGADAVAAWLQNSGAPGNAPAPPLSAAAAQFAGLHLGAHAPHAPPPHALAPLPPPHLLAPPLPLPHLPAQPPQQRPGSGAQQQDHGLPAMPPLGGPEGAVGVAAGAQPGAGVGADETLAQLNTLLALAPERLAAIAATLPPHALSQARPSRPARNQQGLLFILGIKRSARVCHCHVVGWRAGWAPMRAPLVPASCFPSGRARLPGHTLSALLWTRSRDEGRAPLALSRIDCALGFPDGWGAARQGPAAAGAAAAGVAPAVAAGTAGPGPEQGRPGEPAAAAGVGRGRHAAGMARHYATRGGTRGGHLVVRSGSA